MCRRQVRANEDRRKLGLTRKLQNGQSKGVSSKSAAELDAGNQKTPPAQNKADFIASWFEEKEVSEPTPHSSRDKELI